MGKEFVSTVRVFTEGQKTYWLQQIDIPFLMEFVNCTNKGRNQKQNLYRDALV